jgi:hypothetical protein
MPRQLTTLQQQARSTVSEDTPIGQIRVLCAIHGHTYKNFDDFVDESVIKDHEVKVHKHNCIEDFSTLLYSRRWIVNYVNGGRTFRLTAEGERFIDSAYELLNKWEKDNNLPLTKNPNIEDDDTRETAGVKAPPPPPPQNGRPGRRPGTPA